jgi:sterol 3beta-glucosyltransferase
MCAPTSRFPSPGFPTIDVLPDRLARVYNRLTYLFARGLTQFATRHFVRRWRRSVGLDASPERTSLYRQHTGAPVPVVYGFSRHLVPRPPDWPSHVQIAGPWPLERTAELSPPADLDRFLAEGPAPVYVGFGSMRGRDPRGLADVVVRALQTAGVRGVLSSGWGGLEAEDLPADMIRVDDVPHDWLFPRMRAVVHHGGAGTTHTGLRASRPTVICPFMADQPFWGRVVRDRGLGPAPIRQVDLDVTSLARAVRRATDDRAMQRNAARIGARMQQEKGVLRAVELIETLAEHARTG